MIFEYDNAKSQANKDKHGIDFNEAQELWKDDRLLRIKLSFEDEKRFAFIGKIEDKNWTAIATFRNKNIRIISVRRSRKNEVNYYES